MPGAFLMCCARGCVPFVHTSVEMSTDSQKSVDANNTTKYSRENSTFLINWTNMLLVNLPHAQPRLLRITLKSASNAGKVFKFKNNIKD